MIVVDASVVIEILLQTDDGIMIADRLLSGTETLHAPHLIDVEVAQVLRRYVARGQVTVDRAKQALDVMSVFPLTRYGHEPLLDRIWALRENVTAYDAAYVALADGLRATLLTRDRRLAGARRTAGSVEVV